MYKVALPELWCTTERKLFGVMILGAETILQTFLSLNSDIITFYTFIVDRENENNNFLHIKFVTSRLFPFFQIIVQPIGAFL